MVLQKIVGITTVSKRASTGNGNATNAETNNSQDHSRHGNGSRQADRPGRSLRLAGRRAQYRKQRDGRFCRRGVLGGTGNPTLAGMAGALAGTSLTIATQAFLTGSAAGIYGGSTARLLSGTGITPVTVTQDAFMGGANGLIFYGVASAFQQATVPKPSTTSLQERANLAVQMGEAEGCEGGSGTNPSNQINGNSYDINKLQETQSYTYSENVAALKEIIAQEGPNSVQPIAIRVYNGQVLEFLSNMYMVLNWEKFFQMEHIIDHCKSY